MAYNHSWQSVFKPGDSNDFFMQADPPEFRLDVDDFNPVNAWWLSELSRLVYRRDGMEGVEWSERPSRNDFLARVGLVERRFFRGPTVQGALVETIDAGAAAYAVLVFRGTSGRLASWLVNLDMAMRPWHRGGKVHRGFKTALMGIWTEIEQALDAVDRPLYYTGHSLGGALATLAASLRPPRAVYTFGAPHIGNAAFARSLTAVQIYNVCNPRDIVTELPPSGPWFRFTRAGTGVRNIEAAGDHSHFVQAPSFLANHAPLNYTAQLPDISSMGRG